MDSAGRSPTDLPKTYCLTDENQEELLAKIRLLSIDDNKGYGVKYSTGNRVVIEPIDEYLQNGRLHEDYCSV
ncbi:hypothetical protein K0C01_10755 [Salinarchaeum sp. IM2453]|uniref:hypothetical protein n=1 Tax=Salinarchaeum sp. IM2453 TaxID=2862870 RepID=UPI001C83F35B|nr:hypothetical protein [Salinarchaeum sp. IM2453]QZA88254.1 hypothetical protein K0C01_10755 [Salinarchaeum sp. IM2453]